MSNRISSGSASKKAAPKKHGPLKSMELTKAENGMVSQMHFEPHPDAKDEERYGDHLHPAPTVHPKMKHMLDHIKANTAYLFPLATGAAPAAPAPAAGAAPVGGAAAGDAEPDEDDEED